MPLRLGEFLSDLYDFATPFFYKEFITEAHNNCVESILLLQGNENILIVTLGNDRKLILWVILFI